MTALPTSTPQAQGVEPAALRTLLEAWERAGVRPWALTVVRHGSVVAQATWAPYEATDRVQKYSLSKTFTATAVGLAVAEGLLSVHDRVVDFFAGLPRLGPRASALTVENLLTMTSGHTADTRDRLDPDDPVASFLRLEPDAEPGSVFCYNQGCTFMLSAIVQQLTGEPLQTYLGPRLWGPLGIDDVHWLTVGPYDQGFSGLHTTCDAVARLGMMLLGGGMFQGRRVVPRAWVDAATTVHIATGADPRSDWAQGYGYQMWRSRHGWRGDGAFGQLCLVLPEQDLVLAACAQTDDMQAELDLVWEHLLPALHDEPLDAQVADGGLDGFLAGLTLPTVRSTHAPLVGRHELAATGPAAAAVAPDGRVVLADGTLVVDDGGGAVRVPLGDGRWTRGTTVLAGDRTVTVAGTGGWRTPDTLEARLVPLHSPHVLQVRADLTIGTADLRWQTEPLGRTTLARSGSWFGPEA